MSAPFFVVGLPRSRTAWMASFLSYDGNFCHHEGLNGCRTIQEYKDKIGDDGDSGTGLMMFDLNAEFPDSKVVVIDSPISKSVAFINRNFGACDMGMLQYMKDRLDKIDGLHVHFDDIDEALPDIWAHLIGTPYDARRGKLLSGMNVQVENIYAYDNNAASEFLGTQKEYVTCRG